MAKKFVRGITDVKTINNQDYDTNNVNDLLSDGQYNYIHRKKGKNEEYHNLTDNIKTISSDNTDLLTVTNNNKTTNTATLHPKHDAQKEQVLESTRNTVTIQHGTNGTAEKTSVDVNFEKVQEKLSAGDGLAIENNQIIIKPKALRDLPNNNGLYFGNVTGEGVPYGCISLNSENNKYLQVVFREGIQEPGKIISKYRFMVNNVPTSWQEMTLDSSEIKSLLAQKQNKLTAMDGISITGDSIYLTSLNDYSEDLNNLTYTCTAKPIDNAPNLPTGVAGNGILSVKRVGNVVSQTYHALDNNVYYRITNNSSTTFVWTPWVKVNTTALS